MKRKEDRRSNLFLSPGLVVACLPFLGSALTQVILWNILEYVSSLQHAEACCMYRTLLATGIQQPPLYSVLYGIISKGRCVLPRNFSLEKNQGPRELALISKSLACLVDQ
jgi:hypothetical protein